MKELIIDKIMEENDIQYLMEKLNIDRDFLYDVIEKELRLKDDKELIELF